MRAVAAVAVALGLASLAAGLAIVIVGFAPIPFYDSFSFFRKFFDAGGWDGYGLAELYARHNEHRIVVPSLWFLLDIWAFRASQAFLIVLTVVSALLHASVLTWMFRRLEHGGPVLWVFAAVAAGTALSPLAWENLVWSFQVQFIQVWLFATLAFASLTVGEGRRDWNRTALAILCGLAATYTMANGLAVWPLLVGLALWRGLRGAPVWLLVAVGVAVTAVEVAGFQPHSTHSDPADTVLRPIAVIHYALRYLTGGVAIIGPVARDLLGAALVLAVIVMAIEAVLHRGRNRPEHGVWLALAGFVIASALLTGLGRIGFGLAQADASRYATPSLLFLVVVFGLVLDRVARSRIPAAAPVVGIAAVLALLVPGLFLAQRELPAIAGARDSRINAIVGYLASGYRPADLLSLFPRITTVPPRVMAGLDRSGLGPFADRARFMPPPAALHGAAQPPIGDCRGHIDRVVSNPVDGVEVSGWAVDAGGDEQPRWILVTDASGAVVAWGSSLVWRPDVAAALGTRWGGRGFKATGGAATAGPLGVYGVFDDGRRCRVGRAMTPASARFLATLPGNALPATSEAWVVSSGDKAFTADREETPASARPAVTSLGPTSSRLDASLVVTSPEAPSDLLVPVRTGLYPVGARVALVDADTGEELDHHDFGRPSAERWVWLVLHDTGAAAVGRRLLLYATTTDRGAWQGLAVGRPYWLPGRRQE
jgi:hypothetical protein